MKTGQANVGRRSQAFREAACDTWTKCRYRADLQGRETCWFRPDARDSIPGSDESGSGNTTVGGRQTFGSGALFFRWVVLSRSVRRYDRASYPYISLTALKRTDRLNTMLADYVVPWFGLDHPFENGEFAAKQINLWQERRPFGRSDERSVRARVGAGMNLAAVHELREKSTVLAAIAIGAVTTARRRLGGSSVYLRGGSVAVSLPQLRNLPGFAKSRILFIMGDWLAIFNDRSALLPPLLLVSTIPALAITCLTMLGQLVAQHATHGRRRLPTVGRDAIAGYGVPWMDGSIGLDDLVTVGRLGIDDPVEREFRGTARRRFLRRSRFNVRPLKRSWLAPKAAAQ